LAPYLCFWSIATLSLARHNPSVNYSVSLRCPPPALLDSKIGKRCMPLRTGSWTLCIPVFHVPLQGGKGSRRKSQSRCKGKAEFTTTSASPRKSPWRAPRFRRDFFNSPPRRSENTRPGGTFLPTTNCQPTSGGLNRVYPVRTKGIR